MNSWSQSQKMFFWTQNNQKKYGTEYVGGAHLVKRKSRKPCNLTVYVIICLNYTFSSPLLLFLPPTLKLSIDFFNLFFSCLISSFEVLNLFFKCQFSCLYTEQLEHSVENCSSALEMSAWGICKSSVLWSSSSTRAGSSALLVLAVSFGTLGSGSSVSTVEVSEDSL